MASRAATPPYPSAARIADSLCYPQYAASLKCKFLCRGSACPFSLTLLNHRLEEFSPDKSKCQEHFDVYKECKKKEREARLERNRNRSFFS